jgi:hypothetical protein
MGGSTEFHKQQVIKSNKRRAIHNMCNTKTYRIWKAMRKRVNNPNDKHYKDYGERGITICNRWDIFKNFLNDMGECPKNHFIERIDNNGNYEPSNCKWANIIEQANNRRSNVYIEYNKNSYTIAELSRILNINYDRLKYLYRTKKIPLYEILFIENEVYCGR